MRHIAPIILFLQAFMLVAWSINLYKFAQLDFEPSYKTEIIRGLGLVTPIFVVTAWLDIAEEIPTEK